MDAPALPGRIRSADGYGHSLAFNDVCATLRGQPETGSVCQGVAVTSMCARRPHPCGRRSLTDATGPWLPRTVRYRIENLYLNSQPVQSRSYRPLAAAHCSISLRKRNFGLAASEHVEALGPVPPIGNIGRKDAAVERAWMPQRFPIGGAGLRATEPSTMQRIHQTPKTAEPIRFRR